MARGIDHIVHAVRDLDAAADLFRRLGFTVGARNQHPWGTHNHIIQFQGCFIELLTLAEPDKLGSDGFSKLFGRYTGEFLARGEGLALLILESQDAAADERAFRNAAIAASDTMRFEREAKRPNGTTVKVGFSLAFAEDTAAPWIHFATCQQHFPENFWNPAFQSHANGAASIAGVAIVAGKPAEHRDFLSTFTGAEVGTRANTVIAKTPRGDVAVMDPVAFHGAFGNTPHGVTEGARLAALRLTVADLAAAEDVLRAASIEFTANKNALVVSAGTAMGAAIVFEQAGKSAR